MRRGQLLWMLLFVLAAEDSRCDDLGTEESFVVPTGLELKVSRGQILSAQFECYLKIITDPPNAENGPYCNRTWDGWLCWGDSPPGTAVQFCPEYFQDFDPTEKVTKVCNPNGQWFRHPESDRIWSNYTQCSAYIHEKLKFAFSLYYLAIVGHGLSVVSLLISLGIFSCFKSLSCQRISLHKNMFLSFILNSICTVIWLSAVANNQQLVERNPIGCKVLSVLNLYIYGTNYFWMLCEGIYLHTLIIVAVFVGEQQLGWYYVLGWGFPIVPAVTHAVARWVFYNDNIKVHSSRLMTMQASTLSRETVHIFAPSQLLRIVTCQWVPKDRIGKHWSSCWISSDTHLVYIIHGPIHAALLVNLFFLLNIVRVLITKLKVTHSAESNAYMKAVRATLILVPLLGVQFVLVPWRPKGRLALAIYDFIMHIFMHFQGFLVAVIFCFCNGEVQAVLKRHWRRYKVQCRGRLMGVDWHSSYHTNSSITEMSRASISLKPTGPETQVNGLSNGSHSSSGDREGPGGGLETSVI